MEKILIAYYSHSGNTRKLAQAVQEKTGGDLWEIQPLVPYPAGYEETSQRARTEQVEQNYPELSSTPPDLEAYDTVIIGTPNWWGSIAWPVRTFLKETDLFGKTVLLFCTHGGSGVGNIKKELADFCPQTERTPVLAVYGKDSDRQEQLSSWLETVYRLHGE